MDHMKLSHIDEELDSSDVAALCFLCSDVVSKRRMENVKDGKGLFQRLGEKGLLDNDAFLYQLLATIGRVDLLDLLETDSRQPEEADASPPLSGYRVMLYQIFQDMSTENFNAMKFLIEEKLEKRKLEACKTALDVFAEMEKAGLLSKGKLDLLHTILLKYDQKLAGIVQRYMQGLGEVAVPPHLSMDFQRPSIPAQPTQPPASIPETQPISESEGVHCDAEPSPESSSLPDPSDYYILDHNPRGLCVIFNNENFSNLKHRRGTQEDERALASVFTRLGFTVETHKDMTAHEMSGEVKRLSERSFLDEDALVVCVLSHGEEGSVYSADGQMVLIRDLTYPFRSRRAPTLAKKPKLFFIQACQGDGYQSGIVLPPSVPRQVGENQQSMFEEDAGPVLKETVPNDADFLLGMATVQQCKSFRDTSKGSIYIQELCRQLKRSAESSEMDDILTVLTRVNREVSQVDFKLNSGSHKQMPEPKYTLTRKLVLKFVDLP